MSTGDRVRPFVVRRNVNRKVLAFSLLIGTTATLLTAAGHIASLYPSLRRYRRTHRQIFEKIERHGDKYDTAKLITDWKLGDADYVIDKDKRFFIEVPDPTDESPGSFAPLDYSDTDFISRYRQPGSYTTPDGETWRLYSQESKAGAQTVEIIVGFAEKAPWKMIDTTQPDLGLVDRTLEEEARKIAASLPLARTPRGGRVDGYEIVNSNTRKVFDWGPWLRPCYRQAFNSRAVVHAFTWTKATCTSPKQIRTVGSWHYR